MKTKGLLLAVLLTGAATANAQNLVRNPGFEDTVACPENYFEEVGLAQGWTSFSGTSDYANTCAGNPTYAPHSGNGYVGFLTYLDAQNGNHREHVGSALLEPLTVGQEYFVSLFVKRSTMQAGASDKLGVRFSTAPFPVGGYETLPNAAHVYSTEVITDSVSWTRISGSFIADSAYQYIGIGNFFDSLNTVHTAPAAYYYADDIVVSTDSMAWAVGLDEQSIAVAGVYPNPAKTTATVTFRNPAAAMCVLELFDLHGRKVTQIDGITGDSVEIPKNNRENGMYFLQLRTAAGLLATGRIVFE